MACHSNDLKELFENMRTMASSEDSRALKWTVLLPPGDALFTEKLPAVFAFHWILKDL